MDAPPVIGGIAHLLSVAAGHRAPRTTGLLQFERGTEYLWLDVYAASESDGAADLVTFTVDALPPRTAERCPVCSRALTAPGGWERLFAAEPEWPKGRLAMLARRRRVQDMPSSHDVPYAFDKFAAPAHLECALYDYMRGFLGAGGGVTHPALDVTHLAMAGHETFFWSFMLALAAAEPAWGVFHTYRDHLRLRAEVQTWAANALHWFELRMYSVELECTYPPAASLELQALQEQAHAALTINIQMATHTSADRGAGPPGQQSPVPTRDDVGGEGPLGAGLAPAILAPESESDEDDDEDDTVTYHELIAAIDEKDVATVALFFGDVTTYPTAIQDPAGDAVLVSHLLRRAVGNGAIDITALFIDRDVAYTPDLLDVAAGHNNFRVLQLVHEGAPAPRALLLSRGDGALWAAVRRDANENVRYLLEQGVHATPQMLVVALARVTGQKPGNADDRFDVVRRLVRAGVPVTPRIKQLARDQLPQRYKQLLGALGEQHAMPPSQGRRTADAGTPEAAAADAAADDHDDSTVRTGLPDHRTDEAWYRDWFRAARADNVDWTRTILASDILFDYKRRQRVSDDMMLTALEMAAIENAPRVIEAIRQFDGAYYSAERAGLQRLAKSAWEKRGKRGNRALLFIEANE